MHWALKDGEKLKKLEVLIVIKEMGIQQKVLGSRPNRTISSQE